jgi:hypothetical protein
MLGSAFLIRTVDLLWNREDELNMLGNTYWIS